MSLNRGASFTRQSLQGAQRFTRRFRLIALESRVTPASLVPDLIVAQPYLQSNWSVQSTGGTGRQISYGTALTNIGTGPFELHQTNTIRNNSDGTQSVIVNERLYDDVNANGKYDVSIDTTFNDISAGWMDYTPAQGVMHFNEFAMARLRLRPSDQSVGPVVASGPKTSFCLEDLQAYNTSLPGAPTSSKYVCTSTSEGISIGWSDLYSAGLNGQQFSITNLPAGDYWLEVECDYANHMQETNETNNITRIPITIVQGTGSNQLPAVGFLVMSASPSGAQQASTDHVDFFFNQAVDATTFNTGSFTVTGPSGPITVTGVTAVSAVQIRASFAPTTALGTYTAKLLPTVKSAKGAYLDQNNNGTGGEAGDSYTDTFMVTAPSVVTVTPSGPTPAPVGSIRVTYDRLMDSTTFDKSDVVSFKGPGGIDLSGTVTGVTAVTAGGQSNAFDIAFTSVSTPGAYSLVIGSDIQDTSGLSVDQNHDGNPNSAGDQFTATFNIPIPGVYGPDAFGYTAVATPYQTISMAGATGITFTSPFDDDAKVINIGTDKFNFYGTTYTGGSSIYVSTNGLITFGGADSEYQNDNLATRPYPTIAPLWDDWLVGTGNPQARFLKRDTNADGINDQLVIEWNQIYNYDVKSTANPATFQAILELNTGVRPGNIIFNYTDLDVGNASYNNGGSATVGLKSNSTVNSRLVVSQNNNNFPLVGNNKAMLLSVPHVVSITRADPSPATAGEVEFDVQFSEGVTGVANSSFALATTPNMKGSHVYYVSATADPSEWEVSVQSGTGAGTLRLDLVDDDSIVSVAGSRLGGGGNGNGSFNTGEVYSITQPPPQITGSIIGDGTAQRSNVNQVVLQFNYLVNFPANPSDGFVLTGPSGPIAVSVDTSMSAPLLTTAKLTFSGPGTDPGGSLADGKYTLTVLANQVNADGVALDGDGNGTGGDNFVLSFHRLFGDFDGNALIDGQDFGSFRTAFNTNNSAFDFDHNGVVDGLDFGQFRARFGVQL